MKKHWMLGFRALFALLIIPFALRGQWNTFIFYGVVFLGSLFIPWLGKKDEDYYILDCFAMTVFIFSFVPSWFGIWPNPTTLLQTALGFDKIFHMSAGACLAMFAAIAARKHITNKWVFYLGLPVFALAIGGAWEIFEWAFTVLPPPWYMWSGGYSDTMLDMVADTLGGVIVAFVLWKLNYLKTKK